jgi:hypothetical protein
MRRLHAVLLIPLFGATPVRAVAADSDWRVCVAADYNAHVAYVTQPFESDAAGRALEANVGAFLSKQSLPFQNVQCRLPTDLPQAAAERADAESFVKALGFRLTELR